MKDRHRVVTVTLTVTPEEAWSLGRVRRWEERSKDVNIELGPRRLPNDIRS